MKVANDPRARPESAFIEAVRSRFPVEAEIDRILTRKMCHRAGPGYTPIELDDMLSHIRDFLAAKVDGDFSVLDPSWLSGGASKIQMRFTLDWESGISGRVRTPMVLRMEPPEGIGPFQESHRNEAAAHPPSCGAGTWRRMNFASARAVVDRSAAG